MDTPKAGERWIDKDGDEHEVLCVTDKTVFTRLFRNGKLVSEESWARDSYIWDGAKKSAPKQFVYVNVYGGDGSLRARGGYLTRKSADYAATSGRVGCLKIKLEERFDD